MSIADQLVKIVNSYCTALLRQAQFGVLIYADNTQSQLVKCKTWWTVTKVYLRRVFLANSWL